MGSAGCNPIPSGACPTFGRRRCAQTRPCYLLKPVAKLDCVRTSLKTSTRHAVRFPLRVYFVEDNAVIRDRLIVTLNEWVGITVAGHAEGEQAGSAWLTRADSVWDLAIVDLFLKQGNGLGVLQACRARRAPRKVVVLTNYVTPDVRARCHAMGADAFFDKSSELEALFDYCTQLRTALQAPPAA